MKTHFHDWKPLHIAVLSNLSFIHFFFQMKAIFIQGAFKNIQGLLGKFKDFSRIVRTMRFIEEVNKRRRNFLPNIRHFQRIGINVTKSKKPLVHFKSDIFDAVALVDAKTQIWIYATAWQKEGRLKCLCVTNVTGLLWAIKVAWLDFLAGIPPKFEH